MTTNLRRLLSEGTKGPWTIDHDRSGQANLYADGHWIALLPHQCLRSLEVQMNNDAHLIVAAINALPSLLAVVEAVRAADLAFQHEANCQMWRNHSAKYGREVTCRCGMDAVTDALREVKSLDEALGEQEDAK